MKQEQKIKYMTEADMVGRKLPCTLWQIQIDKDFKNFAAPVEASSYGIPEGMNVGFVTFWGAAPEATRWDIGMFFLTEEDTKQAIEFLDRKKYGKLARQCCHKVLPLEVMHSNAGWYIGTVSMDRIPCSRDEALFLRE